MKFRHAVSGGDEKIELQMVPMIDVVFQLLIFFVLTFNPSVPEGNFSIEMPQASSEPDIRPPTFIHVLLKADVNRNLSSITVDNVKKFEADDDPFGKLRSYIIEAVNEGDAKKQANFREKAEVKLEADFDLKYENIIRAVTAVTGYTNDEDEIVRLLHNIKFVQRAEGTKTKAKE